MASGPILSTNPEWPSLYNPHAEIFHIPHHAPIQPGGIYLTDAQDIFRFTLYWTFIFYIPPFIVCGAYAFFNLTFPPSRKVVSRWTAYDRENDYGFDEDVQGALEASTVPGQHPMTPLTSHFDAGNGYQTLRSDMNDGSPLLSRRPISPSHGHSSTYATSSAGHYVPRRPQRKTNERRSRLAFALLVLLFFLLMSMIGAVISSAIVGYVLAGLYKAGKFYMSTWVPFVWALIHVLIGMLNVWPSVIDYI